MLAAIITGVVSLVLIFLVFYWQATASDNLSAMAPKDSLVYLHFDYRPGKINERQQKFFDLLFADLDNKFLKSNQLKLLAELRNNLDRELAVGQDQNNNWFLLLKLKDSRNLLPILTAEKNISLIENKYLIIADDPVVRQTAAVIKNNSRLTLAGGKSLQTFRQNIIKVYLQPAILAKLLNSELAAGLLSTQPAGYFYFSLDKNFNWRSGGNQNNQSLEKLLVYNLPASSIFTAGSSSLSNFSQSLLSQLSVTNPGEQQNLLKLWQSYQNSYHFTPEEIAPFLDRPAQLVVTNNKERHYSLIFKTKEGIDLAKLETIFRNILARRFPEKVEATLPDGSKTKELVSRPENFPLEEVKMGDNLIKVVRSSRPVWELAYTTNGGQLIVSNSLTDIKELLNNGKGLNLNKICQNLAKPNLFINPWQFITDKNLAKYANVLGNLYLDVSGSAAVGCFK